MNNSILVRIARLLPDKAYLSLKYYKAFGRWPNWDNPQTFSEKLQWLKLYDRKPEYTRMVDKYAVKEYVADIIGAEYVIPTLGVWDRPENIEWDKLPNQFVLKTTHGGGGEGVVICRDKASFDRENAIRLLNESLKSDLYVIWREWPYKNVPKRIIAEKFMAPKHNKKGGLISSNSKEYDGKTGDLLTLPNATGGGKYQIINGAIKKINAGYDELVDYKFFCFDGKVRFFKVDFGRFVEHHANYYSPEGELLDFGEEICLPDPNHPIILPVNLNKMVNLAERLSAGMTFLRVDLYNINSSIYFSELTFYPASGMGRFVPEGADYKIGKYLKLVRNES